MLKRIMVANRGEIAARILRLCREMNIETVAVFSEADRGALFTTLAHRAVCIGGPHARDSYLNQEALLTTALATGCDGVHPGFGFLSENAEFATAVEQAGLTFIGPRPETIAQMGDKNAARALMQSVGVPCVPGSSGLVSDFKEASTLASELGFPVLIKATAGGGGKGMRRVDAPQDMEQAFNAASSEAQAAFGDGGVYIEKLILDPRHIEFQILADGQGNIVHLGARDCSLQRNHQKVLEEAPAQILTPAQNARMGADAVKAARAANYRNVGTVEFILDEQGNHYFIEMNTRIQVEHPITEMITGINIVREQVRLASGMPLRLSQEEITFTGHAIECRINAENPHDGFRPCPGTVDYLHLPSGFGVRVDTAMHPGFVISPYYDSMIAKIIVHGKTRNEAIARMRRTLEETVITGKGITTNLGLLYMLMYSPDFITNSFNTSTLENNLEALLSPMDKGRVL